MLSAYIDRELTGAEMLDVRAHVEQCDECRDECDALHQTKRLLASLGTSTPRAELETLLMVRAERATNPSFWDRVLPPEWTDAMLWRFEGIGNFASPRLRPLAATALLSLAGLCLATASVNRVADESPFGDSATGQSFAVFVSDSGTLTRAPMLPMSALMTAGYSAAPNAATTPSDGNMPNDYRTLATPSLPASCERISDMPSGWEDRLILPRTVGNTRPASYSDGSATVRWSLVVVAPR